jgi:hypothetical protein
MVATKKHFVLRKGGEIVGGVRTLKDGVDQAKLAEYIAKREAEGYTLEWVGKPPSIGMLEKWSMDGVAKSIHGKRVEPDHPESWLRVLGYI